MAGNSTIGLSIRTSLVQARFGRRLLFVKGYLTILEVLFKDQAGQNDFAKKQKVGEDTYDHYRSKQLGTETEESMGFTTRGTMSRPEGPWG